jgi:chemotaxis protein methyltransferase CheR
MEMAAQLTDRHFRSIAELVEGLVGIRLPAGKRLMLEGRLQKRMRALQHGSLNEYVEQLFDGQMDQELVHLIDCVTTNKTDFFREPAHFTFLRDVAVPALLRSGVRTNGQPLKIWSAAASTGMEAYTTAMVLDDMIRRGTRFRFRVLGTDISTNVIEVARKAIYHREMIAPVPPEMVGRYFLSSRDQSRPHVRVVPELRQLVNFMRMNLMDATYPVDQNVDLIFCRNVLIYFDKPTQNKVVERLASHLRPGGYLMVGHSESMVHQGVKGLRQVQPTIFTI